MGEYRYFQSGTADPVRPARAALHLLSFITGFIIVSATINGTITQRYWKPALPQSQKLQELARVSKDVNVLFVGSSHYAHGIVPEIFDRQTQADGVKTTSFNLSFNGLFVYEQLDLLRELRQLDLPNLRYVVYEPRLNSTPVLGQIMSDRIRYASNWSNTLMSMRLKYYSGRDTTWHVTAGTYGMKTLAFAVHLLNLGVLSDCILPDIDSPRPVEVSPARGYEPYGRPFARGNTPPALNFRNSENDSSSASKYEVDLVEMALKSISELGAEPIVMVAPFDPNSIHSHYLGKSIPQEIQKRCPNAVVLNYSYDGHKEGVYARPELWFDADHINDAGAELFTAELAKDFVSITRREGAPR